MSLLFKPLRPGWSWLEENHFQALYIKIIEVATEENAPIYSCPRTLQKVGIPALPRAAVKQFPFHL